MLELKSNGCAKGVVLFWETEVNHHRGETMFCNMFI